MGRAPRDSTDENRGMSGIGTQTADVIVVGAGVTGTIISRRLAQAGLSVTLIERDRPGAEASSAAAGILIPEAGPDVPGPMLAFWRRGHALYPALIDALHRESGLPVEYRMTGRLVVALDSQEAAALEERASWQRAARIPVETVGAEALRRLEPALTDAAYAGLLFPDHALVDNTRLTQAMAGAAVQAGVRLVAGRAVTGLAADGDTVQGVQTVDGVLAAGTVINAAGSWAGLLDSRAWLPVAPAKGQMVAFQTWPPPLRHIIGSRYGVLAPRADGRVLAGSTVEEAGFDKRSTAGAVAGILAGAIAVVPALRNSVLEAPWAGLRPRCTVDGRPIIGPDPRWRGLYHATGHFKMGIISAPATAEAVAHHLLGTSCSLDLTPFAPSRLW